MSKQISNKDLATLKQAYFTLGSTLDDLKNGDYEMGVINFELTKSLLSSVEGVSLNPAKPTQKGKPESTSGIQPPAPEAPEPPKSMEAAGYIPPSLLRTPSASEILSHTLDRTDYRGGDR